MMIAVALALPTVTASNCGSLTAGQAGERQDKVSITMFGKHSVYSSEELIFLHSVLDEAVGRLPARIRTSSSRSAIAKRIVDCAATGERDRVELRIAGLAEFLEAGESAA